MARRPRGAPAQTPQQKREASWLARHPGASNPRSPNYDPNWKQRARGHKVVIRGGRKVSEHVTRAERARAAGRTTEREQSAIRRFANKQAKRSGREPADVYARLKTIADVRGFASIERIKAFVASKHGLKRRRVRRRLRQGVVEFEGVLAERNRNVEDMEDLLDDLGLGDDDFDLLYYH